jgi:hypothetical protein
MFLMVEKFDEKSVWKLVEMVLDFVLGKRFG